MKILQIAGGFTYSKVYRELFHSLYFNNVELQIYNPQHVEDKTTVNCNDYPYIIHSNTIIKKYDKLLYFTKLIRIVKDIESKVDLSKIYLIHAHSLFSDGGVAYLLNKKYNIPFVVAIRNTDINKYYKYAFHLRKFALNILLKSKKCIFISSPYRDLVVKEYVSNKYKNNIAKKSIVIPNGVSKFWFNNINYQQKEIDSRNVKIISVGVINRNKNVLNAIKACSQIMKDESINIQFYLVGSISDYNYFNKIMKYKFVKYFGYITQDELLSLYKNSDMFVMPSIHETFGLVYVEAMSQGLPVIYTKRQGFDSQFEDGSVGYGVDPENISDIANKINQILIEYKNISNGVADKISEFDWDKIAQIYLKLYHECIFEVRE